MQWGTFRWPICENQNVWNILHGASLVAGEFIECEWRTIGGNQDGVVACMCRRCACSLVYVGGQEF